MNDSGSDQGPGQTVGSAPVPPESPRYKAQTPEPDDGQGRNKPAKSAKKVAAVFLALVLLGVAIAAAWCWTQRKEWRGVPGVRFATREIFVLIDRTRSIKPQDRTGGDEYLEKARQIVQDAVRNFGPGDRVSCYSVATGFDEMRQYVFGQPNMPEIVTGLPRATTIGEQCRYATEIESACTAAPGVRDDWTKRIAAVTWDVPDGLSSYLDALQYAGERLKTSPRNEKWLVVVGDLEEDPPPRPFKAPPPPDGQGQLFSGVKVRMIEPIRAKNAKNAKNAHSRDEWHQFWKDYFVSRGMGEHGEDLVFLPFTGADGVIPSNQFCDIPSKCKTLPCP